MRIKNKIYAKHILLASCYLLLATFVLSCSKDDLVVSGTGYNKDGQHIGVNFNIKASNMTRAAATINTNQHYEFGAFAYRPTIDLNTDEESSVFLNDLVAYATTTNAYKKFADTNHASTWGNGSDRSTSYWVYESLGYDDVKEPTGMTSPNTKSEWLNQYIRYWDYYYDYTYFWAYTPYMRSSNSGVNIPNGERSMTFGGSGTTGTLTFSKVSSFYTNPVTGKQIDQLVTTGLMQESGYNSSASITTENELINANEVMYAATPMAVANYDNDVDLTFKHANCKIQIGIYEELPGWQVELIDMIPQSAADAINDESTFTGYPNVTTAVEGIVLTPATEEYAGSYLQVAKNTDYEAKYYDCAKMQIGNIVNTTVANTESFKIGGGTSDHATYNNIYFKIPAAGTNLPTTKADAIKSENLLPTTYYALPNTQGGARIDNGDPNYPTGLSSNTGFTFHISYKMKSVDSDEQLAVYDARVFVPASEFSWIAGKSYIYVFRITRNSNGVPNPKKPDPTNPSTPYLDEDDPRVTSDPAMSPIIFDGVVVQDYEDTTSSQHNLPDDQQP